MNYLMNRMATLVLAIVMIAGIPAYAVKYVAVVETDVDAASGVSAILNPAEVRQITAELRRQATKNLPPDRYSVMTSETVMSMGGAVLEECAEENCVISLGSKIGADYIVRGTVSKFGTKITLSVELYETDQGTLIVSSEPVHAENAGELFGKASTTVANMYREFVEIIATTKRQTAVVTQQPVYETPAPTPQPQYQPPAPSTASTLSTPSTLGANGTLTDGRDGKKYKTVVIGGKRWMGENLNYQTTSGAWCYGDDNSNCNKYGRLYDWKTAKTVCPGGWHLPSRQEWNDLEKASGGNKAGKALKSASGWNKGNGTDKYGFSALPGGFRVSGGDFDFAGNYGYWWTATEDDGSSAYRRRMNSNNGNVYEGNGVKGYGFSVRCVAD